MTKALTQTEKDLALAELCKSNKNIEMIELAIAEGANVNFSYSSSSPNLLMMAVENRQLEVINTLLNHGVDINAANACDRFHDYTPLHLSVYIFNQEATQLLLDRGADPNKLVNNSSTLIMASTLGYVTMVKMLLKAGANINFKCDTNGLTAFSTAVDNAYGDVLKALLDDNNLEVDDLTLRNAHSKLANKPHAATVIGNHILSRVSQSSMLDQNAGVTRPTRSRL